MLVVIVKPCWIHIDQVIKKGLPSLINLQLLSKKYHKVRNFHKKNFRKIHKYPSIAAYKIHKYPSIAAYQEMIRAPAKGFHTIGSVGISSACLKTKVN